MQHSSRNWKYPIETKIKELNFVFFKKMNCNFEEILCYLRFLFHFNVGIT